jgi:hypothetical protein
MYRARKRRRTEKRLKAGDLGKLSAGSPRMAAACASSWSPPAHAAGSCA